MILYFANRRMEIMGNASTNLRRGYVVKEDLKSEDIETGVSTFECRIGFNSKTRSKLEEMTKAGNYLLRKHDGESEFYTIIDTEIDTKNAEVYIYAEDAGLDLLNEIAEAYAATEAHTAEWYINKWIIDSGFEIGINEIPASSERKLSWEGESTVTERLASIATQFGGYEISFSFEIKGMEVSKKFVNIYAERGKSTEETLRLNREVDRIIIKQSVANLATAFRCTGGTPEDSENPITLNGYNYDDGDFYVSSDGILRSRNAVEKWSRYVWNNEPNKLDGYSGHIIRTYSYDTLSQATLCAHAVTELKKVCDTEINYEIDINTLPANIKIGDRINIVDDAGELYLSSRLLKLETSISENTQKATIGEHLIKDSGISMKIAELAAKFAETAKSAARAKSIADAAKTTADQAQKTADDALAGSNNAIEKANEATAAASSATQSAAAASTAASEAQAAVENVEKNVENLEATVSNAQTAASNAQQAAETAGTKADEAKQAATNALADAAEANAAVEVAQSTANTATSKAEAAQSTANTAKSEAATAQATADAAKLDAAKANEDIASLGENLETVSQTMQADYARKTELTEATASLQTQITQNAAEISSTASKVVEIDETANNAAEQAAQAQTTAQAAQTKAEQATADAEAAQKAADDAASAAEAAQGEADTAKAAATTAQGVADKAKTDLEAAKADLATVKGRVDATEEDIAAAEQAVATAQAAADAAKADAATAAQKATAAQSTADTAKANAATAQTAANNASAQATAAQKAAEAAQGDATAAQTTADEAKANAQAAQSTADTAKTNAATAQSKADAAAQAAQAAQTAADNADAKAAAAASDLATAKSNLAAVTSRVDATEAEIAEAEAAVIAAQAAADSAASAASAAQSTANTAKANAATAQTAANNAKTAADNAQKAADDAQDAADAAQAAVDSLAVRVTTAETNISQNAEQIALRAKKTEVAQTLGNYYTKTETNAAITTKANEITSTVEKTYQKTVSKGEQLVTNGNGLMGDNTNFSTWAFDGAIANNSAGSFTKAAGSAGTYTTDEYFPVNPSNEYTFSLDAKSAKGVGKLYSMLMFFDADKNQISAGNHIHNAASTTTLAKDLKSGDTVIYLTDSSGWSTTFSYGFYMTVWNYKNSFGYTYPAGTYSRTRITLPKNGNYLNSANLNKTAHTITLASAYSGATIPAGTSVSQGGDGATYKYFPCSNTVIPNTWTSYSGKISGVDYSGQNKANMFPPGTAYSKIGFLWNYQGSGNGEQLWVTNLSVTDTTAVSAAQKAADDAQSTANTAKNNAATAQSDVNALKTRVTQTESSITSQAASISSQGARISTLEQNAEGFTVRLETVEADAIVSTVEQFYLSSSATALSGGSWSNNQPTWTNGKYIWRRTLVTYGDGTTAYTPSSTGVCITGNTGATGATGATGPTGPTGPAGANGTDGQMLYATCGTAAATAAKVATLASGTLTLKAGATVAVKFTYANSASSPTLNVASTGAKSIRLNGAALTAAAYYWVAGAVVTFVYDGSYWNISDAAALSKANSAQTTANTANSTANTAKTNAATAQSTADSAAAAASAAQTTANTANSTANTAKTNAATAQSTADSAASAASAAQTTANSVKTDLASNYTKKTIPDTRNTNETPQWYISNYPKQIITEFKSASVIGLSGETYCTLETTVPWGDTSGGYPKQVAKIGGKEYWRIGTSTTAWGSWNDALGTATSAASAASTAQSTANTARTEAANAAKTATNYLSFSNSGLVIGDMTASTLGRNILIDSDSVDIRNGTTILASYQANKIQLGLNSTSSVIELCGGMGTVAYETNNLLSGNHLALKSKKAVLFGEDNAYLLSGFNEAKAGGKSASTCVGVGTYTLTLSADRCDNLESNGGIFQSSYIQLDAYDLYALADTIQLVSRYGITMDSGTDPIDLTCSQLVSSGRIHANGGLRLANGGQIVGGTSSGTDITMVQMNASNYIMFGYGGYTNKIGATYLDGNTVNIRSNGAINLTGTASLTGSLTLTGAINMPNNTWINMKNTSGTNLSILKITDSNGIAFGYGLYSAKSGYNNLYGGSGVLLAIPNATVGLYASSNSTYNAFFRPSVTGKTTLGTSDYKWYAVYATNGTIQTSDRREKENIIPIGIKQLMPSDDGGPDIVVDLHSELFDRLQPVQYNFIEGNGKTCFGLIAQDVIETMHEIGMNEEEFELVQHDFWPNEETGETKEVYGLSYTNLFALLIHEVQKLKKEVKTLKAS